MSEYIFNINKDTWPKGADPIERIVKYLGITNFETIEEINKEIIITDGTIKLDFTIIKNFLASHPGKITVTFINPSIKIFMGESFSINRNVATIQSFSKSSEYSGKTLMEFIIKFLKSLAVTEIQLTDVASIPCGDEEIDLLFLDLMRYGKTWYERFGFVPNPKKVLISGTSYETEIDRYKDIVTRMRNMPMKVMEENIQEINDKAIEIILNHDYREVTIDISSFLDEKNKDTVAKNKLFYLFTMTNTCLEIITNFKAQFPDISFPTLKFSDFITKLFDDNCENYQNFYKLFDDKIDNTLRSWMNMSIYRDAFYIDNKRYLFPWTTDMCALGNIIGNLSFVLYFDTPKDTKKK